MFVSLLWPRCVFTLINCPCCCTVMQSFIFTVWFKKKSAIWYISHGILHNNYPAMALWWLYDTVPLCVGMHLNISTIIAVVCVYVWWDEVLFCASVWILPEVPLLLLGIKQHTAHIHKNTHECTDTNTHGSPCGDYQIPSDPLEASDWSGIHFAFYLLAMEDLKTGVLRNITHPHPYMCTHRVSQSTKNIKFPYLLYYYIKY